MCWWPEYVRNQLHHKVSVGVEYSSKRNKEKENELSHLCLINIGSTRTIGKGKFVKKRKLTEVLEIPVFYKLRISDL